MTRIIEEGNIRFDFEAGWAVVQYDRHPHYRKHLVGVKPSDGLDVVAFHQSAGLRLLEIKDYRTRPPSLHQREELPNRVATKVRDSISGMIGAFHMDGDSIWGTLCPPLLKEGDRPTVALLMVERTATDTVGRNRDKTRRGALLKQLKAAMRWLTAPSKVYLLDLSNFHEVFPNVSVTDRFRDGL